MKKLMYRFHCLSIRKKLIISFAVLVIVPILSSLLFSYSVLNRILLEKISDANVDSLNRTAKRIDSLLNDMSHTLINISSNPDLRDIMRNDDGTNGADYNYDNQKKVNDILDRIPLSMIGFSNITVLDADGTSYGNWEGFHTYVKAMKESSWYAQLAGSYSESILWIGTNMVISKPSIGDIYMVEAGVPVKQYTHSLYNSGILHIAVPETIFYDILKPVNRPEDIFLVDETGRILSCADKGMIGSTIGWIDDINRSSASNENWFTSNDRGNENMVITFAGLNKAGWKVVSVMQRNRMLAPMNSTRNLLLTINLSFILSFIVVALLISNSISKPLINLARRMKGVETGDFSQKVDIVYEDEIGNLSRDFNHMLDKVSELMELAKLNEKQKREAELEALQAQINPHFLFNTLSSIRWAAAASGDSKAEEMVLALSNLLRMSIGKGPDMIPLSEEITILRYYVDLYRMKQGHDLVLECDLPEEMLDIKVPRLLLQPIVENSIIHGFEEKKENCMIRVYGEIKGSSAVIYLEDNGKGIEQERISDIMNGRDFMNNKGRIFSKIGVKNVNDRIRLNYGDRYGLKLANGAAGGTITTVTIPFNREV